MTEDDTFRVLKRSPFAVVDQLYNELVWKSLTTYRTSRESNLPIRMDMLSGHGWTYEEYCDARAKLEWE